MKHSILTLLLITLIGYSCRESRKIQNHDLIEKISMDTEKHPPNLCLDISFMIDTSYFEIIPLETNDECLISEVSNIYLSENKIVIYDEKAKGAFIFNRDGSYHAKVHAVGQGPGEYPPWVNDISASDNYIGVLTSPGIMLYNYDGKYVKTISLDNRWGANIFTFDEINYFLVNCWSMTMDLKKNVFFHLFQFDTKQNRIYSSLPFSQKDIDNRRGWGLDKYCSLSEEEALIYISTIDTIYRVTPDGKVSPRFVVDIIHNKIPDNLRTGDGTTALQSAAKNNYITGIKNVTVTARYLFLRFNSGYNIIYDKSEKKTIATAFSYKISSFWEEISHQIDFSTKKGDKLIVSNPGYLNYMLKEYISELKSRNKWNIGDGINQFQKELIKHLTNMQGEDDNPMIFIFKMKDEK